jgi:AcrR family transcriptional regulator
VPNVTPAADTPAPPPSGAPAGPAATGGVTGLAHGRALRADAQRNRDRLVAAASAAFADNGPEASLEDIARRAGVGIGTLYRHFPTRERLMAAVVRESFEDLRSRAAAGRGSDDPWGAVEGWVRSYLAFAATKRGLVAGIVLLKEEDDEFGGLCDRMFGAVDALVVQAQDAGVLRAGVRGRDLLHLCSGIAHSAEHSDDPALADRLIDISLAGLRTS